MDKGTQPSSVVIPSHLQPAPPWRRVAASVLDTAVLLLWNVLIVAIVAVATPDRAADLPLPLIGMVSATVYLAAGWALWGMTLGKWLLGIRVVGADGSALSWGRSLGRVAALLLASAPLKLGLAAMLWDERRRGWHDRLAGTIVVSTSPGTARAAGAQFRAEQVSGASSTDAEPPWAPQPRGRSSRGERLIAAAVLVGYLLAALALTMPLIFNFSTHIPGAEVRGLSQDGYVFLWDYWWVRKALADPDLSVMSTSYLFWPYEVSLRYHTLVLLHSAAAALLQDALTLVQTYNLLLLLSLAACAWGAFLLCRYLTGSTLAAAVAGLAFGFCPYMTTHALAHQNVIAAEWLAPMAYSALRGLRERRLRYVLGAGASWALVGLCDWYYFLYAGMFLAIMLGYEVAACPRRWAGAMVAAAGVVALTAAALWPLLAPMLAERQQASYVQQPLARPAALGAQPGLYLTPAFTHPLFGDAGSAVLGFLHYSRAEATLYLGAVVIALALTGVAYRRRQLAPWTAGAVFFLVLALGPYLRLGHMMQFSALAVLLLGGPPGNGFDLPLSAELSSHVALSLVGGQNPLAAGTQIPLPYLWLWQYVPLMRLAAVPTRAALPGMLCVIVLAAAGLTVIMQGVSRRWRVTIGAMAAALVLFEFAPVPYPMRDVRVPGFYRRLARCEGQFAVGEVPLLGDYIVYMYYQTAHHKPLLAGRVSRQPWPALAFVRGNALLRDLQPNRDRLRGAPVLWLTEKGALDRNLEQLRATYRPALGQVRENGVGLLVTHRHMLTRADMVALERVLDHALGLPAAEEGDGIMAYHLAAQPVNRGPGATP